VIQTVAVTGRFGRRGTAKAPLGRVGLVLIAPVLQTSLPRPSGPVLAVLGAAGTTGTGERAASTVSLTGLLPSRAPLTRPALVVPGAMQAWLRITDRHATTTAAVVMAIRVLFCARVRAGRSRRSCLSRWPGSVVSRLWRLLLSCLARIRRRCILCDVSRRQKTVSRPCARAVTEVLGFHAARWRLGWASAAVGGPARLYEARLDRGADQTSRTSSNRHACAGHHRG